MKKKSFPKLLMYISLCCILTFSLGLVAGCKGSTGDTGAQGPTGPPGPSGQNLTAAAANEQCLICHGPGAIAAIATVHGTSGTVAAPEPLVATFATGTATSLTINFSNQSAAALSSLTPTIQNIVVSVGTSTPNPIVNFTVKDQTTGLGIVGLTANIIPTGGTTPITNRLAFALAELVNDPQAGTTAWQSYIIATSTISGSTITGRPSSEPGTGFPGSTLVDHNDGSYTFTFGQNVVNGPISAFYPFDATATHRLTIQFSSPAAPAGSPFSTLYAAANAVYDFRPDGNPVTVTRNIVGKRACQACHGTFYISDEDAAAVHGGSRTDPNYCVVCHTYQRVNGRTVSSPTSTGLLTGNTYVLSGPTGSNFAQAEAVIFFHKIHRGEDLALQGSFVGEALNEITYPQDIRNCTACHIGADGDNWKNKPTRKACGSCHDNISWQSAPPAGFIAHSGGVPMSDDSLCGACHTPGSNIVLGTEVGISGVHVAVVPPDPTDARLGGTNTHTNAEYIAAAGVVPFGSGAAQVVWIVDSVTVANGHPSIKFKFHDNTSNTDLVFTAPTSTASELMPNFAGSPSAYFVWATPQDGVTAPADFNQSASAYIRNVWNGAISSATATITGPDGSGFYTLTRTGTTIPSTAVMVTGGIGYTYGSGSPPLVQTNLSAYPYNATTGVGGLSVPAPNVWKVATGYTGRRVAVDTAKCDACHGALGVAPTFHAGQRNDAPTCSFCHNPNRTSEGWALNASTFVHAIHGTSKRTVLFTWDATSVTGDEPDDGFFKTTYPNVLNNCLACHVSGFYDFSASAYTPTLMNSLLFSTAATGTFSSTAVDKFTFSPYVSLDTNYGSAGSGDNLVTSPISAACFACHDTATAMDHMRANGGAVYEKRSTAIQP